MAELRRESLGRTWLGGWGGNDRSVALKHKRVVSWVSWTDGE